MSGNFYVQVPDDSTGKRLRTRTSTVDGTLMHSEVMVLEDGNGNLLIPLSENGTIKISMGTIGVSQGTLNTINSIITLNNVGTLNSGSLQYVGNVGTLPNIVVGSGTIQTLNSGSLQYIGNIGTLPSVTVSSGTIQFSGGTLTATGTVTASMTDGTISVVTQIGTIPNVIIGSGTIQTLNAGTITTVSAAYLAGAGTLQTVTQVGTLPNIIVGSGTLQMLNAGTITTVSNCYLAGAGTVVVASGTLTGSNPSAGTLDTITKMGTLYNIGTLSSGSLQYVGNVGTLPNIIVGSGTIQTLNNGTLTSIGSANVYAKHDLHVYDSLGTLLTDQGTLVQTASKIIKVHYYHAQADGTFAFHFADTKPNGGTLSCGWNFNQREGAVTSFVPYPAYLFKTTTAGSALVLGTWPSVPCNGTLRLTMIYTDDDTA